MKYADAGKRLPEIETFLDEQAIKFIREVYEKTGLPNGHEFRKIVEDLGGEWECEERPTEQYDTLNIPHKDGILIIERPWIDSKNKSIEGHHRVSYCGEITSDLEESLKTYLAELHKKEREKSRQFFLNGSRRFPEDEMKKITELF